MDKVDLSQVSIHTLIDSFKKDKDQNIDVLEKSLRKYVEDLCSVVYKKAMADGRAAESATAWQHYIDFVGNALEINEINIFEPEFATKVSPQYKKLLNGNEDRIARFLYWGNNGDDDEPKA